MATPGQRSLTGRIHWLKADVRGLIPRFDNETPRSNHWIAVNHSADPSDRLDYSLLFALPGTEAFRIQMGLAGYEQRQTTAKTGPGLSSTESANRYAVNALGFAVIGAVPKHRLTFGFKYFKEFGNRSTYQGYSVQALSSR